MTALEMIGGSTTQKLYDSDSQLNDVFNECLQDSDIKNLISSQVRFCSQAYPSNISEEEKQQIGCVGLWLTIRKFDSNYGNKFTTFLYHQIRCEYLNYLNRTMPKSRDIPFSEFEDCDITEYSRNHYEEVELRELISKLPPKLAQIIKMRFFDGETLREVGETLNYTSERIRQLQNEALKQMEENALRINTDESRDRA